jgi:hypothetical protein
MEVLFEEEGNKGDGQLCSMGYLQRVTVQTITLLLTLWTLLVTSDISGTCHLSANIMKLYYFSRAFLDNQKTQQPNPQVLGVGLTTFLFVCFWQY